MSAAQIYRSICPVCFGSRRQEIVDYRTQRICYYPCGRCGGAGTVEEVKQGGSQ